jgi:hypothetical protein
MHEKVSKSPDRGEKYANKVVPTAGSETPPLESNGSNSNLRVVWCDSRLRDVWSPKLNVSKGVADDFARSGAGERATASPADTAQDGPGEAAAEPASQTILPQSHRLAMLAAALAAAATLGAFVGSLSVGGVAQFWPHIAPSSANVAASGGAQATKTELVELSALKTDLEGVARNLNNHFAKLAERLDRMERAEADLHAKLAHIGEAVDRLEMASRAR